MQLYQRALKHADGLGFFVKRIDIDIPSEPRRKRVRGRMHRAIATAFTPRFLVRSVVNGHIANRLKQLRSHYQWNQQALESDDPERTWFADRQQELDELAQELPSWRRVLAALRLLAGPATAALLIYLGGDDIWKALFSADLFQLGTLALVGIFLIIYPTIPFALSFSYKRATFLGGPEHPTTDESCGDTPDNIYLAENRLWSTLRAAKSPEPQLDRWYTYAFFLFALLEGIAAVMSDDRRGLFIFGAIFFLVLGISALLSDRKRRYR
jgi:hypothetical protein